MEEKELPSTCVNCQAEFIGDFCHQCGQKRKVARLTLSSAWFDFQQLFFGLDSKFIRTFGTIWVNPGKVAKANIEGNRVRYVGPVSYFFIAITLLVLMVTSFGVDWNDFMMQNTSAFAAESEGQRKFQESITTKMFENFRTFQFFIIPFLALSAKIFFRKTGFNYLEHMVLVFYVQAQMVFISILNLISYLIFEKTFLMLSAPIGFLFFGWACVTFYPGKSKVKRFFKGVFAQTLGMVFFLFAFMIAMLLFILIYSMISPEFLDQFREVK